FFRDYCRTPSAPSLPAPGNCMTRFKGNRQRRLGLSWISWKHSLRDWRRVAPDHERREAAIDHAGNIFQHSRSILCVVRRHSLAVRLGNIRGTWAEKGSKVSAESDTAFGSIRN